MFEVDRENILQILAMDYVSRFSDGTVLYVQLITYCLKVLLRDSGNILIQMEKILTPLQNVVSELGKMLRDKNKCAGQSYDGAGVMSGAMNSVQVKVRDVYH